MRTRGATHTLPFLEMAKEWLPTANSLRICHISFCSGVLRTHGVYVCMCMRVCLHAYLALHVCVRWVRDLDVKGDAHRFVLGLCVVHAQLALSPTPPTHTPARYLQPQGERKEEREREERERDREERVRQGREERKSEKGGGDETQRIQRVKACAAVMCASKRRHDGEC